MSHELLVFFGFAVAFVNLVPADNPIDRER
jgi:hypothetical protein